ncbi:OmpA family protein [Cupriavidus respiraculi]|uniref:Outer membrane protein A n=1 Tax=Cupriavidus respiraculi TaxID=195930 RepID=A0ABN7ZG29_9BURK|nr:OmpA family protein [Cupriavidus respiraculi]MBY4949534.1 OmpA family protein [Cupriavidus respiraculi]CAG9183975.1 Outer membrane protein A [Cupriavidus respiraculi]
MSRNISAGLLLSALACAASGVLAMPLAHPTSGSQTDKGAPAALQARLDRLAHLSASPSRTRAQCWIDLARRERQQSATHANRTPDKALHNADALIGALEEGRGNAPVEPIFTERVYPSTDPRHGRPSWFADIRQIEDALAAYRDRHCETPLSACLDVAYQSVMENMEESRGGRWHHGRTEVDHALALARRTPDDLAACAGRPTATPLADPAPVATAPRQRVVIAQRLAADALFGFDRADLTTAGREALDRFVSGLAQRSDVVRIRVVGYTDRFGGDAYNVALSRRRAQAVRRYLQARAVKLPIVEIGAGASRPRADCPGRADEATVACLQPNRRVELTAESSAELETSSGFPPHESAFASGAIEAERQLAETVAGGDQP